MRRYPVALALLVAGIGCHVSDQTVVADRTQNELPPILTLNAPLPMFDGQTQTIRPTLIDPSGRNNRVLVWSTDMGTIGQDGSFIAPTTFPGSGNNLSVDAHISAYVQDYPSVKSDTTVRIRKVAVTGLPGNINIDPNGSTLLLPTLNAPEGVSTDVIYSTINGGGVDANGFYTAPGHDGLALVRAVSVADPRRFSQSLVNVGGAGIRVGVFPDHAAMAYGDSLQLTASVVGTSETGVAWTTTNGTVTQNGLFTPNAAGPATVTVTSLKNPTANALSSISVQTPRVLIYPDHLNMKTGDTRQFTAIVSGAKDPAVTWYADNGVVTQAGLFKATAAQNTTIKAVLNSDAATFGVATVSVSNLDQGVEIFVLPPDVRLLLGMNQTFKALVYGTPNTSVFWSTTGGNITQNGSYAATEVGTWIAKATSLANPSKSASANITVVQATNDIMMFINPNAVTLGPGGTVQFNGIVTGSTDTAVLWSASGGTINGSGFYTAPTASGTYMVTAAAHADPTKTAQAVVTVQPGGWTPGGSTTLYGTLTGPNGATGTVKVTVQATFAAPFIASASTATRGAAPSAASTTLPNVVPFMVFITDYVWNGLHYGGQGDGSFDTNTSVASSNSPTDFTLMGPTDPATGICQCGLYDFLIKYDASIPPNGGISGTFTPTGVPAPDPRSVFYVTIPY